MMRIGRGRAGAGAAATKIIEMKGLIVTIVVLPLRDDDESQSNKAVEQPTIAPTTTQTFEPEP